jgi:hypothetical protein
MRADRCGTVFLADVREINLSVCGWKSASDPNESCQGSKGNERAHQIEHIHGHGHFG